MTGITILWASLARPDDIFVLKGADAGQDSSGSPSQGSGAILLVDGRDVSRFAVTLPGVKGDKARAAATFAIEDQIAQSIDDCHIALGETTDRTTLVDVINSDGLRQITEKVSEQGFNLKAIYSELSVLASRGTGAVYSIQSDTEVRTFQLDDTGDGVHLALAESMGISADRSLEITTLGAWAADLSEPTLGGVNLAQGAFKPRANLGEIWLLWRRAGMMAALFLMLLAGLHFGETQSLRAQIADLDETADAQMQASFPGVRNLSHMRQRLAALNETSGDPFLGLSAILIESLAEIEGANIVSLRFDSSRGTLSAALELNRFEDVRALSRGISARGGTMTEGSSRQTGPLIISDIRVERAR